MAWRPFLVSIISLAVLLGIGFFGGAVFQGHVSLLRERNAAAVLPAVVITLTNADRTRANLLPLAENLLLDQAAQMKADDMLSRQYYAHASPEGYLPFHWLDLVGYKYLNVGENLDLTYIGTNEAVDSAWMGSPEHRANILLPQFTETGVGVASGMYNGYQVTFVVQEFATPYPFPAALTRKIIPEIKSVPPIDASSPITKLTTPASSTPAAVITTPVPAPETVTASEILAPYSAERFLDALRAFANTLQEITSGFFPASAPSPAL